MAEKRQPYGINNIVSWGATIVIIGLLFKIQHWPYGGTFISAGLITEAALFFLLGFQREKEEDHIDQDLLLLLDLFYFNLADFGLSTAQQ